MTIAGNVYGVVLNDGEELLKLAPEFQTKPYNAPPQAPVVYMKPGNAIARGPVKVAAGAQVNAAATLALLFARDATKCSAAEALDNVGGVALALDISYPRKDYYRPAIVQQNGDGFLALGDWQAPLFPAVIATAIDGNPAHSWPLDRLNRSPAQLVADLSQFMTLRAGDVLLVGLPGDAPQVSAGQSVTVTAEGMPALQATFEEAQS